MESSRQDEAIAIFQSAVPLARSERPAFLDSACAGDRPLREAVDRLFADLQETETVHLAVDRSRRSLHPGDLLQNRFRIRRFVGQGGMGEVYEAEDQELGGRVALKAIRPHHAGDPEFLGRFRREVQLARQVTHPNVCRVFDVGYHRDGDTERAFLTMEFLDGETLSEHLRRRGPLPLDAALPLIRQLTDGLAALHEKGIVHRDFKPGNVMVVASVSGQSSRAVISDFGLARVLVDSSASADFSRSGHVIGTPDYMAPEQLLGRAVTPSSDIYSLGLVIYEMVTGRKPFPGGQPLENAVQRMVEKPTPPSEHSSRVNAAWNDTILRCLEREPKDRPASVSDVWNALAGLSPPSTSSHSTSRRIAFTRPKWLALPSRKVLRTSLLFAFLAFAAGLAGWKLREPRQDLRLMNARRLTSGSGLHAYPSVSPDGRQVVFSSDRGDGKRLNLWVQPTNEAGGEAVRLTSADADDTEAAWSPDGKLLAFRSTRDVGGVFLMLASGGGAARLIGPAGRGPRFSPDGKYLLYSIPDPLSGHGRAYVSGIALPSLHPDEPDHMIRDFEDVHNLGWLPDSQQVVFCGTRRSGDPAQEHDFWVTDLFTRKTVKTGAFEAMKPLRVSPHSATLAANYMEWHNGGVLFAAESLEGLGMWYQPLNASFAAAGPPRLVSSGIHPSGNSVSGSVAYSLVSANSDIWALPVDLNRGALTGHPERLTTDPAEDMLPAPTPDGRTVLFGTRRSDPGQMEYGGFAFSLWKLDRATRTESAVDGAKAPLGRLKLCTHPDRAVYRFLEGSPIAKAAIYETVLATGVTRRLCAECGGPTHCSQDGKVLAIEVPSRPVRLALLESGRPAAEILRHPQYSLRSARLSSDGWIAFHEDRNSAEKQVFVAKLNGHEPLSARDWIPITGPEGANQEAIWSPDNSLLYFLSDRDGFRCIWAQPLHPASKRPNGAPFGVYHLHQSSFSALTSVGRGPWNVGLSVGGDRLIVSLSQIKSDVWLAAASQ